MAKSKVEKIKLVSTGTLQDGRATGIFKTTKKNRTNLPEKLKKKFYDRRAYNTETGKSGMHVLFVESGSIKK